MAVLDAWIGLGGNLGDVAETMAHAIRLLDEHPQISVARCSAIYETPPWGKEDQPPFLNAAAKLETRLQPHQLLEVVLSVEQKLGRIRTEKWGPRTIDLDILKMNEIMIEDERLTLPHPYVLERAFVLMPVLEISPDFSVHGQSGKAVLNQLDTAGIKKRAELILK